MVIVTVGIDLAKNVFAVDSTDEHSKPSQGSSQNSEESSGKEKTNPILT